MMRCDTQGQMSTTAQLRNLLRQTKTNILDQKTKGLLVGELKKRIRRNQKKQLDEVVDLLRRTSKLDTDAIQPILRRCYLQGRYWDHEDLRYFLKANIETWPHESILLSLRQSKDSLEARAKSINKIPTIKFPGLKERHLPVLSEFVQAEEAESTVDLMPLNIFDSSYSDKYQRFNAMLTKVMTLYRFLVQTPFLHSRNLKTPIAIIPVTVLGDEIAECRKKNLIKKKISYIRNIMLVVPPMEVVNSDYLTSLVDQFHLPFVHNHERLLSNKVRREYKKFLRKTYTIDQDFQMHLNKYAYIQAHPHENQDLFNPVEKLT